MNQVSVTMLRLLTLLSSQTTPLTVKGIAERYKRKFPPSTTQDSIEYLELITRRIESKLEVCYQSGLANPIVIFVQETDQLEHCYVITPAGVQFLKQD